MGELKVWYVDTIESEGNYVEYYEKSEADKFIKELQGTIAQLDDNVAFYKAKLESVNELIKTSHDMMDDAIATNGQVLSMRERKILRSLWLARAERAKDRQQLFLFSRSYDKLCIDGFYDPYSGRRELSPIKWVKVFNKVENKCRDKAEEYI